MLVRNYDGPDPNGGTNHYHTFTVVARGPDNTLYIMDGGGSFNAAGTHLVDAWHGGGILRPTFTLSGTSLTVNGTSGDDTFAFAAGATQCTVTANGVSRKYANTAVKAVAFNGMAGTDSITIAEAGRTAETAKLWPAHLTFTGSPQSVTRPSAWRRQLSTAAQATRHICTIRRATTISRAGQPRPSCKAQASPIPSTLSRQSTPTRTLAQQAELYDSAGNDTFTAYPTYATLTGTGYYNYAAGFHSLTAHATAGGTNTAKFYQLPWNDTFTAHPGSASMGPTSYVAGTGYQNEADGFDKVYAYATAGGFDTADLYDPWGSYTFTAYPTYATLTGTGFYNYAGGFDKVNAHRAGGTDTARLYGLGRQRHVPGGACELDPVGHGFQQFRQRFRKRLCLRNDRRLGQSHAQRQ